MAVHFLQHLQKPEAPTVNPRLSTKGLSRRTGKALRSLGVHESTSHPRMDLQSLRDHCLIIVGSGGETDELLARRRIAAGGRLVHVLTRGVDDERVSIFATDRLSSCFFWLPPQAETSSFGKRLGPSFRTYWSKTGPDAVRLGERQTLQIYMQYGPEEHSQHIRILDQEDSAVVEISGHVVLNPDMKVAQER